MHPTISWACKTFLYVHRKFEPPNGHPGLDLNQNHIGISPGANLLDHSLLPLTSNIFNRRACIRSSLLHMEPFKVSPRQPMCLVVVWLVGAMHVEATCFFQSIAAVHIGYWGVHLYVANAILWLRQVPCTSLLSHYDSRPLSVSKYWAAPRSIGHGISTVGNSLEDDWRWSFFTCSQKSVTSVLTQRVLPLGDLSALLCHGY